MASGYINGVYFGNIPAGYNGPVSSTPNTIANSGQSNPSASKSQPTQAPNTSIQTVNPQQLGGAYGSTQGALAQQSSFLAQLGLQNGLGLQTGLANQLAAESQGAGPNPALAQLAMTTGRNSQQQAAMMNSARGANSNPGLIATQAGRIGAQNQQEAAGQAGALRAQQQLAAQAQLSGLSSTMVAQQQLGNQQYVQNLLGNQNQLLGGAGTLNNQTLTQNLANQGYTMQAVGGGLNALGSVPGYAGQAGAAGDQGSYTTPFNGGTYDASGNYIPMTPGGAGGFAQGGMVQNFADGGGVPASPLEAYTPNVFQQERVESNGPKSMLGQMQQPDMQIPSKGAPPPDNTGQIVSTIASMLPMVAGASRGGYVGGKAKVNGDSSKNDTVPARLSPGEIVIPRSHVGDSKKAAAFLNSLMGWNMRA